MIMFRSISKKLAKRRHFKQVEAKFINAFIKDGLSEKLAKKYARTDAKENIRMLADKLWLE